MTEILPFESNVLSLYKFIRMVSVISSCVHKSIFSMQYFQLCTRMYKKITEAAKKGDF